MSKHSQKGYGALVDKGANVVITGGDVCLITKVVQELVTTRLDNHQIINLTIVTAGGVRVTQSQQGKNLVIFHQHAYVPSSKTIYSSLQIEAFKNTVDDKSIQAANGTQSIHTNYGYLFALSIQMGCLTCKLGHSQMQSGKSYHM